MPPQGRFRGCPQPRLNWPKEARDLAAKLRSIRGARDMGPPEVAILEYQVVILRKKLLTFWRGCGPRSPAYAQHFTRWWQALNAEDKRDFLLTASPFMPDFANQSEVERGGEVRVITGIDAIAPELHVSGLTACNGQRLLDMFEERVAEAEAWHAPGRTALFIGELDARDAKSVIKQVDQGDLDPQKPDCMVNNLASATPVGLPKRFTVNDRSEAQKAIDRSHGMLMWWDHYYYTRMRQTQLLSTLHALASYYMAHVWRREIIEDDLEDLTPEEEARNLGLDQRSTLRGSMPSTGSAPDRLRSASGSGGAAAGCNKKTCSACGVAACKGTKLRSCGGCEAVHYCNRECQAAHWHTHKQQCARKDRQ